MSKPIEDYALVGDGKTTALIARDGSVDWLCWPRFDSEACFAALLGTQEHGRYLIAPAFEGWRTTRRYRPDTLVLETEFSRGANSARIIDFMPIGGRDSSLIRIVEGLSGQVPLRLDLSFRFDYGLVPPWIDARADAVVAIAGPHQAVFRPPVPVQCSDGAVSAEFTVSAGQTVPFVLTYGRSFKPAPATPDPARALAATERWWRDWAGNFNRETRWREAVVRSLITLKALVHHASGGLVGAATSSLPEVIGGKSNWDYRYCWLRDATFTVGALLNAGYHNEAVAWRDWMLRAFAGSADKLRIMYRVSGSRRLEEWSPEWLPGYEDSRPVRFGNSAAAQEQIDVHGELIEALHLLRKAEIARTEHDLKVEHALVERLETVWHDTGHGLWEDRGSQKDYVYPKVMAWVGIDRFLKGATRERAGDQMLARLSALRDTIHAQVCEKGYDSRHGHFVHHYGGKRLDGSLLLIPATGFLPIDDDRIRGTIAAIERDLMEDGFVLRKPRDESPHEGAFLPCTFWLADCYTMQGRQREAEVLLERALAIRNDLGLLSEEYDITRRRLCGNFPQALSHLALINTALGLSGPVLERAGG